MKQVHFLDGETSYLMNRNTHVRTTKYNSKVNCELQYVNIGDLSYFNDKQNKLNVTERLSQEQLTTSIIKYGMLLPIMVFPNNLYDLSQGYTIIDGEKRAKAELQNGQSKIRSLIMYNVTPNTAKVMRLMLNERVYINADHLFDLYDNIRNITDQFSTNEIETMLNLNSGDFAKLSTLKMMLKKYQNDSSISENLQDCYDNLLNNQITIDTALNQFEDIEKKYLKKKQRDDKKSQKDNSKDDMDKIDNGADAIEQDKGDESLLNIGEQDHQQYVGDERRILPSSLIKQIYARDESMCTICGYGGARNLSVSTQLEKHHIVDVQYGGTDNINNLVLLCPNCHHLVTTFLNGKATEYKPNPEDLKRNPQNWACVALGNMGRIAKEEALRRIKKADEKVYNQIINNKMTVGQGLKKLRLTKIMPKEFNNHPYFTFKKALFYFKKNMEGFNIYNHTILKEYLQNQDNISDINNMINLHRDKTPNEKLEELADQQNKYNNQSVKDVIKPAKNSEVVSSEQAIKDSLNKQFSDNIKVKEIKQNNDEKLNIHFNNK